MEFDNFSHLVLNLKDVCLKHHDLYLSPCDNSACKAWVAYNKDESLIFEWKISLYNISKTWTKEAEDILNSIFEKNNKKQIVEEIIK